MCELLVCLRTHSIPGDSIADTARCVKRGHVIVVRNDGFVWGREETLPNFVVVKIPSIAIVAVKKYAQHFEDVNHNIVRRRRWRLRFNDLPQAVRDKVQDNGGVLTIRAGAYAGPYDYTWAQVRGYFRDDETGADETGDL